MRDELHRYLDGELPPEALDPRSRAEAEAWERLVSSFRGAAPRASAPPWLEERVMAEIARVPERSALSRLLSWLVSPAPVRVPPLAAGLAVAAVAALLLVPGRGAAPAPDGNGASGPVAGVEAEPVVYVQFVLEAPGASSVAVAGDFSGWEPSFALEDADGDGVWSGRVPVRPGVHAYMFVIDGTTWQTDPNAERYRDDGFGNRNAVLAVGASG
ncbi:MAG TPA: glycogen-binding domain-containing protein [Longimicrobiales bacterium]|nr:glycogen-binding domain-containing protein [Longimicrobiales bacterium]